MKKVRSRKKVVAHQRSVERRRLKRIRVLRDPISDRLPSLLDETVLPAPAKFTLEGHHDNVATFLALLRNAVSTGSRPVCIDFRPTTLMVAGATLLFFSELHRLREMYPATPLRCIAPKNNTVEQVLQHLKIFDLLGYESSVKPSRDDVTSWRKASSSEVDGEKIGTLIQAYKSLDDLRARYVFRGATEAMMNAMNHAYIEPRNDGLPRPAEEKWWMFCRKDEDRIIVAVCDLGIGIPRSLPILYPAELIADALSKASRGRIQSDARMIEAAMEIQRTRTGRRGRGRGLGDIKRLVDEVPGGQLYIFSNKGLVKYSGAAYSRKNFGRSIKGTVVLWIVPLNGESDD